MLTYTLSHDQRFWSRCIGYVCGAGPLERQNTILIGYFDRGIAWLVWLKNRVCMGATQFNAPIKPHCWCLAIQLNFLTNVQPQRKSLSERIERSCIAIRYQELSIDRNRHFWYWPWSRNIPSHNKTNVCLAAMPCGLILMFCGCLFCNRPPENLGYLIFWCRYPQQQKKKWRLLFLCFDACTKMLQRGFI